MRGDFECKGGRFGGRDALAPRIRPPTPCKLLSPRLRQAPDRQRRHRLAPDGTPSFPRPRPRRRPHRRRARRTCLRSDNPPRSCRRARDPPRTRQHPMPPRMPPSRRRPRQCRRLRRRSKPLQSHNSSAYRPRPRKCRWRHRFGQHRIRHRRYRAAFRPSRTQRCTRSSPRLLQIRHHLPAEFCSRPRHRYSSPRSSTTSSSSFPSDNPPQWQRIGTSRGPGHHRRRPLESPEQRST